MKRRFYFFTVFAFYFVLNPILSYAKNFPPEIKITQEGLNLISQIEKIKIPEGGFRIFYYDKEFAVMANDENYSADLDLKKAVKLSPYLRAVGITVKQTKPGNEYMFENYECAMHLFVTHRDDYWLPPGKAGSNREFSNIANETNSFAEIGSYQLGNLTRDYYMRSFYGNTKTDHLDDNPQVLGSLNLSRFVRNIYDGIDYLEYDSLCNHIIEDIDVLSVWLEKKSGPDLQVYRAYHQKKDFYIFAIPQDMLKESCQYIQKGAYYWVWNIDLEMFPYNKSHYGGQDFYSNIRQYSCNF